MSYVDTALEPATRDTFLREVRAFLPAFLGAAAIERQGPINAAAELLNLPPADLRRVLAVHILLSEPIRSFVSDLPIGLRRPIKSSYRPRVAGPTISSGIDWSATMRHQFTSSPTGGVWVTRPARRVFDVPENQALSWVLRALKEKADIATPSTGPTAEWGKEIQSMAKIIHKQSQNAWLEGIPAEWPGDHVYARLRASRVGFYRTRLSNAAKRLRQLTVHPSAADVATALCERFFEPTRDWQLFEIAVLVRLVRAFDTLYERVSASRMFVGGERGAFARYRLSPREELRLWYQEWPPGSGPSELQNAATYYKIGSAVTRPDIILEFLLNKVPRRLVILELKASTRPTYLAEGLAQLLGYLRDRPRLTNTEASGWLVAPPSRAYTTRPTEGRAVWVVSSDSVAAAARDMVRAYSNIDVAEPARSYDFDIAFGTTPTPSDRRFPSDSQDVRD